MSDTHPFRAGAARGGEGKRERGGIAFLSEPVPAESERYRGQQERGWEARGICTHDAKLGKYQKKAFMHYTGGLWARV